MPDINMQVFEETKRNQLVTEVDIQTQVALDDYQVQLSDIANPTQSQDNVVIDRFGEFLPHWNESLDFDTWIKMSMEVAGKRLLMLRGNSSISSVSNGSDVFVGFFDGDEAGWTEVDPNSHIAFTNNRLEFTGLGRNENAYVYKSISAQGDFYIDYTWKITANESNAQIGFSSLGDSIASIQTIDNVITNNFQGFSNNYILKRVSDAQTVSSAGTGLSLNTQYWTEMYKSGNTVYLKVYSNSAKTSQVGSTLNLSVSDVTMSNLLYLYLIQTRNSGNALYLSGWIDDFITRKYTAIEPTWAADGEEQNIVVALKSLGRAG